jgi:hypothetical protein
MPLRAFESRNRRTRTFALARFLGVYEDFHGGNRFSHAGYGPHYVAIGYEVRSTHKLEPVFEQSEYL